MIYDTSGGNRSSLEIATSFVVGIISFSEWHPTPISFHNSISIDFLSFAIFFSSVFYLLSYDIKCMVDSLWDTGVNKEFFL